MNHLKLLIRAQQDVTQFPGLIYLDTKRNTDSANNKQKDQLFCKTNKK